ncbi:MAG: M15 family metallopeptidase [Candidatus Omnitrophica bacterium]|nr:M15 family metallopeptidase [Candidatus Omnitrophota bacterium]
MRKLLYVCLAFAVLTPAAFGLDLDKLSPEDHRLSRQIINKLQPLIQERDARGDLATLTFAELETPLTLKEKKFLRRFRRLDREKVGVRIPWRGLSTGVRDLVAIKGQKVREGMKVRKDGKLETVRIDRTLPPQFLPSLVYQKYSAMMEVMEKDLGRRLYVESGYRSSAFQLYLFVYYLRNHKDSIRETAKFVALPGYSEHGAPDYQAIDFINRDGINGDPNVEEFEALPEYRWLVDHAHEFGFVLSYPKGRGAGITYEPWHWRYDPKAAEARAQALAVKRKP